MKPKKTKKPTDKLARHVESAALAVEEPKHSGALVVPAAQMADLNQRAEAIKELALFNSVEIPGAWSIGAWMRRAPG